MYSQIADFRFRNSAWFEKLSLRSDDIRELMFVICLNIYSFKLKFVCVWSNTCKQTLTVTMKQNKPNNKPVTGAKTSLTTAQKKTNLPLAHVS